METNISRLNENKDYIEFGVFYSETTIEDAYDSLHCYKVPSDLKDRVYDLIKEARAGALSWSEVEDFLWQHKVA